MNLQKEIKKLIGRYGLTAVRKTVDKWVNQSCNNCKFESLPSGAYPCRKCIANPGVSRFEPKE